MYLGSPRMVEVVVGAKVSPEESGRRAHALCTESGCGDALVADDKEALEFARSYFRTCKRSGENRWFAVPKHHGGKPIAD